MDAQRAYGFATRAIHVGQEPDAGTGAVVVPIYATSTFAQQEMDHVATNFLVAWIVVDGRPVARAVNIHGERWAERGVRAGAQGNNAVGQQNAFVHVVGDEHHGFLILLPDAGDFILQRRAREGVERGEWFIEQEYLRVHRQRSRQAHTLSHAAGKFARTFVARGREID